MTEEITKVCTKCGLEKPLSEYYNQKGQKHGKQPRCKACQKEYRQQYYQSNRETILIRTAEYQKNHPEVGRRSNKKYQETHKDEINRRARLRDAENPEQRALIRRKAKDANPIHGLFVQTRSRAKQSNIPFTIEESDLALPEVCPVLGIPLVWTEKSRSGNTPSVDRIFPDLGYIKDNVAVISWRANRLKNDGTADELQKIANWMRSFGSQV